MSGKKEVTPGFGDEQSDADFVASEIKLEDRSVVVEAMKSEFGRKHLADLVEAEEIVGLTVHGDQ